MASPDQLAIDRLNARTIRRLLAAGRDTSGSKLTAARRAHWEHVLATTYAHVKEDA